MMNKKDLKMYEAPACEVVELEASVALLASSTESDVPGVETEEPSEVL